jgi:hypothetical protein
LVSVGAEIEVVVGVEVVVWFGEGGTIECRPNVSGPLYFARYVVAAGDGVPEDGVDGRLDLGKGTGAVS